MNYVEKTESKQKSWRVFLLLICIVLAMFILYAIVAPLKYASLIQLVIFTISGGSIYILIRYFMTVHEYSIYGGKLIFSRGEGRRSAALIMLDFKDIELIAPVSYSGIHLPHSSKIYTVNACSSLGAKNHYSWCVYARQGGDELCKVTFEPSDLMLSKLNVVLADKIVLKGEN